MGTRIRLGQGFTFGASGLRWGHSIPGVKRSYFSTGRSGTLLVGGHLRHWEPNRRPSAARGTAPRCQGLTAKGNQCANTASLVPIDDPRPPRQRGALTCAVHQGQCAALAAVTATSAPTPPVGSDVSPHRPGSRVDRNHDAWRRLGVPPWLQAILTFGTLALVAVVLAAAFTQQAGFHRADKAAGLAAATAAGAPGICLADQSYNYGPNPDHLSWDISTTGVCRTGVNEHFVPVASTRITITVPALAPAPTSLNPLVTQASIATTICRPGWTATVRPPAGYTNQLKATQLAASGWADQTPAHYEEDHITPLELGGSPRAEANLRPQPWAQARVKDVEENRLHAAVCAGSMTLDAAQAEMGRFLPGATAP